MFKRFNTWYDGLQEPNRFLLLLAWMVPTICLMNCTAVILVAIGIVMLIAIMVVALSRV